jgi:hypothetical protein
LTCSFCYWSRSRRIVRGAIDVIEQILVRSFVSDPLWFMKPVLGWARAHGAIDV